MLPRTAWREDEGGLRADPVLADARASVDCFVELGRGAYREVAEASRGAYAALFGQLAEGYRGCWAPRLLQAWPAMPYPTCMTASTRTRRHNEKARPLAGLPVLLLTGAVRRGAPSSAS